MARKDEHSTWLEGPQVPGQYEDPSNPSSYRGERLGLPEAGPGSLARLGSRMGAFLIDWLICYAIAFFLTPVTPRSIPISTAVLVLFFVWRTVTVWLFAQSPGHAVVGIGVARVDRHDERVGLLRAVVRALLSLIVFPPLIQDTDGRGIHDRLTGSAVIRTR
ncbi:RDD family protein [Corynebacterium bovis]|uniref:RDD family protein n=1 Tax=Corynebacterium bovis TaxID=36808 RepID=UPI002550FCBB|nr:RDD family protein [Corynebacterium bovis]MDK8510197.1 RDD family protein [Corynebacterium bovis]